MTEAPALLNTLEGVEEQAPELIHTDDGFWVNALTGEIIDVDCPGQEGREGSEKQDFEVTDEASADWVLAKIMDAESKITGWNEQLRAILENIKSLVKEQERRIDHLRYRFKDQLEVYAKSELEGGKKKSLKMIHGVLQFRKKNARIEVKDETKAVDWARIEVPETVKVVETFLKSELPDDVKKEILSGKIKVDGLTVIPEENEFQIKTGVKTK